MKPSKAAQLCCAILPVLICLLTTLFFCDKKAGYFIDELYSYGLANSSYAPFLNDIAGGDLVDVVLTSRQLTEYLTVNDGEEFSFFGSVSYNQSQDVHPPLYYWLLHLVCGIFPGSYALSLGLGLNLLIFAATLLLFYRLVLEMTASCRIAALSVLLYGLGRSAISSVLLIRMYQLLSFFTVLLAFFALRLIRTSVRRSFIRYSLACGLTITGGLLTQYYFVFYAFFFCAVFCLYLLLRRYWTELAVFVPSALGGVALAVALFPASVSHMTSSKLVSGSEAASNLLEVSRWAAQLKYYIIQAESGVWLAVRLGLVLVLLLFLRRKALVHLLKDHALPSEELLVCLPAFPALVLIALVSPVYASRYIWALSPVLVLLVSWCLKALLAGVIFWQPVPELSGSAQPADDIADAAARPRKLPASISDLLSSSKARGVVFGLLLLMVSAAGFLLLNNSKYAPEYLCEDAPARQEALTAYADSPCLYVENNDKAAMTQDLAELLLFDEVYATDSLLSEGTAAYLSGCADTSCLIIFFDTSSEWGSGYDAKALLTDFVSSTTGASYTSFTRLYAYGLSEVWLVRK